MTVKRGRESNLKGEGRVTTDLNRNASIPVKHISDTYGTEERETKGSITDRRNRF